MVYIVLFNIILYLLVLIWAYKSMYVLELKTKLIYIISSIILIYIITNILYNIGGNPIGKEFGEAAITFNRTMIILFTGINSLILVPQIGRVLNKYKEEEIDIVKLKKNIIIIIIIFIVFMILEFNYIKDMQTSMLMLIRQK